MVGHVTNTFVAIVLEAENNFRLPVLPWCMVN
jgi:hypothetical protein